MGKNLDPEESSQNKQHQKPSPHPPAPRDPSLSSSLFSCHTYSTLETKRDDPLAPIAPKSSAMRIRKHASMIIGSASSFGWLSSAAPPAASAAADPPGDVCLLNRSPWDVIPSFSCSDHSDLEDLGLLKLDDEESIGSQQILTQGNIRTIPRLPEDEIKDNSKRNKKIKKKDDAKTKECCKKNDGKGWRCKKPAQPPHTLCKYHLAQLRSYGDSHKAPTASPSTRARRKSKASAKAGAVTDFYYYSEFGPWRAKRRSEDGVVKCDGGEKHSKDEEESVGDCAGIDGCDDDSVEDKIDAHESERKTEGDGYGEGGGGGRRRGRKRIKARSLKSLL